MRRCLLALVLLTAACGGDDKTNSTGAGSPATIGSGTAAPGAQPAGVASQPFVVVESATNISSSFDGGYFVQWIATLKNPNDDLYGVFPTVAVTARDATGAVVGTDDQVLESFPPGATIAFASQIKATAEPATIDITYKRVEWSKTKTRPADYPPFTAEMVSFTPDRVAGFTVSGDLRNPYSQPVDELAVTALVRDAGGKLLGGRTTFVDGLPAGGTAPFSFTTGTVEGAGASIDIVAIVWGSSPDVWNKLAQS